MATGRSVDLDWLVQMALSPSLLGCLVAGQQTLFIERQLGGAKAIVAQHEISLVQAQCAGRVFSRQIRERRALDRMECAEVGAFDIQLTVGALNCIKEFAIALADGADDKLCRETSSRPPALGTRTAARKTIFAKILFTLQSQGS